MIGFYSSHGSIYAHYRVRRDGKSVSLKYFPGLKDDGWNKDTRRFKDQELNAKLVNIEKAINDVLLGNDPALMTSKIFSEKINEQLTGVRKRQTSFFDYCDTYYQSALSQYEKISARSIQVTIDKLRSFNPGLTFEKIDRIFYRDFMKYLKGLNLSLNYTGLHIKNLKRILNHATDSGINKNMAFREFKKPTENVFNVYLTEEEIEAIYNLKITDLMALELQRESNPNMSQANINDMVESLERARKLFVIGCWTGLRAENYLSIDPDIQVDLEKGFIHVIANKNGPKLKIPLHKFVREIVQSAGFPRPVTQQKLNNQIKTLGKLASKDCPSLKQPVMFSKTLGNSRKQFTKLKYEMITTHTARRSFCSNLYLKGIPIQYIMAVSGHKNESTFRKYIAQVQKDSLSSKLSDYDIWD